MLEENPQGILGELDQYPRRFQLGNVAVPGLSAFLHLLGCNLSMRRKKKLKNTYCKGDNRGSCGLSLKACANGVRWRKNNLKLSFLSRVECFLSYMALGHDGTRTLLHKRCVGSAAAYHASTADSTWATPRDTASLAVAARAFLVAPCRLLGLQSIGVG